MVELPWEEKVPMLSIHPDAASAGDTARLASELMQALAKIQRLEKKRWAAPSLQDIVDYRKQNPELSNVDAYDFWKGYDDGGWIDTQGKPVRNWKLKMRTRSNFERQREGKSLYRKRCVACGKPGIRYRLEVGEKVYYCVEHLQKPRPNRQVAEMIDMKTVPNEQKKWIAMRKELDALEAKE